MTGTGTGAFKPGDRVYVADPGLAELRAIMRRATGKEPPPNHHGTVEEVWPNGTVLIDFDDGCAAPYPPAEVRRLTDDCPPPELDLDEPDEATLALLAGDEPVDPHDCGLYPRPEPPAPF
jgi:hypothetical protein